MTTHVQTVLKPAVSEPHRRDAIDRMIEGDERRNLAVLVQMSGLRSDLRRRALEGLADCNARTELEMLAGDTTLEPSLRRRANELR